MKKQRLSRLIYSNFMAAALIPILLIEISLLVIYFSVNTYLSHKSSDMITKKATLGLDLVAEKEALLINNQLKEVARDTVLLQSEYEEFFRDVKIFSGAAGEPVFARHANGALYKADDNGGSALYYSSDTDIGQKELDKARNTEVFDTLFKSLVENNELIAQVYINTYDNMNRIYPFIPDIAGQYGPVLKMDSYNFYNMADSEHDPERKPVWTGAYLDPAGMGWMISCVAPVYKGDFLEGVAGIDITIDNFIKYVLNINLPVAAGAFLMDRGGVILAMSGDVERILHIKELKEHYYYKNVDKTVLKPEEFNILSSHSSSGGKELRKFYRTGASNAMLTIDGKEYIVHRKLIPEAGWNLFLLTDMDKLLAARKNLQFISYEIGIVTMILMALFYLAIYVFFNRRSRWLSEKISRPIINLSASTKRIGTEFLSFDYDESEIFEIDQLNRNFDDMSAQLEKRAKELVRSEVEKLEKEQEAERLLVISVTDPLTGIYNRLKVDEVLDYEIKQTNRYNNQLSVIIGDIDHFKNVNDTYGHQTGDKVLKEMAGLMKKTIRKSDTLARWGGEEFLVVCTGTGIEEAFTLAEKLRELMEAHEFPLEGNLTASFGVAQFSPGETRESLIKRADEALYEAKRLSRNLVVKKYA